MFPYTYMWFLMNVTDDCEITLYKLLTKVKILLTQSKLLKSAFRHFNVDDGVTSQSGRQHEITNITMSP